MTAPTLNLGTAPEIVPSKGSANGTPDNPQSATDGSGGLVDHLRAWREAGGVAGPARNPIEKLTDNPKSLRMAVTGKCFDCIGGDADPSWRWRIGNCGCTTCPLYAVRPYQSQAGRPIPANLAATA